MKKSEFKRYSNSQIVYAIDEWVHSSKHREIMKDALVDGLTYGEIADKNYMSEVAIKKNRYKQWECTLE